MAPQKTFSGLEDGFRDAFQDVGDAVEKDGGSLRGHPVPADMGPSFLCQEDMFHKRHPCAWGGAAATDVAEPVAVVVVRGGR